MKAKTTADGIQWIADAIFDAGKRITETAVPGNDAAGGVVGCLTEAVMGITAGLCRIAESINNLAEAVREQKDP